MDLWAQWAVQATTDEKVKRARRVTGGFQAQLVVLASKGPEATLEVQECKAHRGLRALTGCQEMLDSQDNVGHQENQELR